jgi:DNA-binding MarR family transcriptional regulator
MDRPHDDNAALTLATELHRSVLHLTRQLRATRAPGAMSGSKLLVLGILLQESVETAADLAARLNVQPQTLTRPLAALEADGLIRRDPDPADRRRHRIRITEAGKKALDADMSERRQRLAAALQCTLTSAEQDVLRIAAGLIGRVTDAVTPAARGGATDPDTDDDGHIEDSLTATTS